MRLDLLNLLLMMITALAESNPAKAVPPIDDLIDGVVARSAAVYQAQVDFDVTEKQGKRADILQDVRTDHYQLTVSGTDWLLRHTGSPNLIMKRDAATLRYYETESPGGERHRSLHLDAAQTLDDAQGCNPLFAVTRYGSFWYPAQAAFVDRRRDKARFVDQQTLAGVDTYAVQWEVTGPDFDEALIVIPPQIARQRRGYLRIYVAPDLGYALPRMEYRTVDDTVAKRYESSDFTEIDQGTFYPRVVQRTTKHADRLCLTEFHVHDIKHVNQQIPSETFAIRIPAQTRVRDSRPGLPRTVFLLEETMDLDDLESTLTGVSPGSPRLALRMLCLAVNAAAVLTLIAFWVRKRCSKAHHAFLVATTLPLVFPASGQGQLTTEFTLQQVYQQIERHQSFVRLCGPLSAIRALSLLGHPVDSRAVVQRYLGAEAAGVKLQRIVDLCREYDVRSKAVACSDRDIRHLTAPCILLVNEGRHCIVLEALVFGSHSAVIWDPSDLKRKTIPLSILKRMWSGQAILFQRQPWSDSALVLVTTGILALTIAQQLHQRQRVDRTKSPFN